MIELIPTRLLPKTPEVPGLYFSPTKCNDVKLYMNADDDGSAPVIRYGGQNDDEKVYNPPRMWRDIYDAICNSKQLIYLVGWSFDTDQYLLRGEELDKALADNKYSPKLGELLKIKAEEGLVVNLMQWDDFSSNMVVETGKMGTHDEKTRNFFKGTKVNARFMGMAGGETNTILQGTSKRMVFTHHQKFIIMDAPKVDDDRLYGTCGIQNIAPQHAVRQMTMSAHLYSGQPIYKLTDNTPNVEEWDQYNTPCPRLLRSTAVVVKNNQGNKKLEHEDIKSIVLMHIFEIIENDLIDPQRAVMYQRTAAQFFRLFKTAIASYCHTDKPVNFVLQRVIEPPVVGENNILASSGI
jgi:hypothetical protein